MNNTIKTWMSGTLAAAMFAGSVALIPATAEAAGPDGSYQVAQWGGGPQQRGWHRPGGWRGGYAVAPQRYHGWRGPGYYGGSYYNDPGAALAAGVVGLAAGAMIGGAIANQQRYASGDDYTAYCSQRYRSFNPGTGTYLGNDGYEHRCIAPE